MGAMDPVKNRTGQDERVQRQERLRKEDRRQQVRAVARGRRGI